MSRQTVHLKHLRVCQPFRVEFHGMPPCEISYSRPPGLTRRQKRRPAVASCVSRPVLLRGPIFLLYLFPCAVATPVQCFLMYYCCPSLLCLAKSAPVSCAVKLSRAPFLHRHCGCAMIMNTLYPNNCPKWERTMTLQKLRRWLGFPLEDRYRVHIEQDIVQSSLRPGIFSALLILAFQAVMMVLSLLRKGGPFASLRRQGYWWLYVTLFSVTLLFLLLIVFLMRRRRPCLDTFFLPLQTFYTAFLCLWGTCVTLLDQFGGNSLSVFTYVTLSAAALTVLQPWQSALIFTGNCLFLNLLLPYTPAGPDNFYSNAVNSCFVTLGAFFISLWFYRSKVSSRYAKIIIEQQNADIRSMNVQLDQMAHTDELTGMKNRRSLERLPLDDRWNEMPPVSAMMVDIDFFKQFNDTYGHLAGDECLQRIAAVIRQFMEGREGVAVRFGGEEFFICLFSCSRAQVLEAGETLRAAVERCGYPRGDLPQGCITVSIGAATTEAENAPRLEDLLSRADKALYEAKHEGRNCVAAYI
ncbi:GGDEF domain-containing protein [Subdoligranulum sp. AM16-9]|nr:GGDEF domain-containing protein [Ruthenibacterium lactatiformans]RGC99386.1 GGDEF domain-containing protein [Subdoligranulum sp. AM16-9]RJV94957.1 GGDEF domain-containing protein [Subdoligranulum sp. AF14-43]